MLESKPSNPPVYTVQAPGTNPNGMQQGRIMAPGGGGVGSMLVRAALQSATSQGRNSAQLKATHESSSISLQSSLAMKMNQKPGLRPSGLPGQGKPVMEFGPGALQCKPGALRPNLSGNAIQRAYVEKMRGVTRKQVADEKEAEAKAEAEGSGWGVYSGNILGPGKKRKIKGVIGFDPSSGLGYKDTISFKDEDGVEHTLPVLDSSVFPPYVDFKDYVIKGAYCTIEYQGSRAADYAEAERITGKSCAPGQVWHHVSDFSDGYGTMQLLPKSIHKCSHKGGVEQAKSAGHFPFYG